MHKWQSSHVLTFEGPIQWCLPAHCNLPRKASFIHSITSHLYIQSIWFIHSNLHNLYIQYTFIYSFLTHISLLFLLTSCTHIIYIHGYISNYTCQRHLWKNNHFGLLFFPGVVTMYMPCIFLLSFHVFLFHLLAIVMIFSMWKV